MCSYPYHAHLLKFMYNLSFGSLFCFSFKDWFQCWESGAWCSWGYSGLQPECSAGAGSCESSPGICTMEITPDFPWCFNEIHLRRWARGHARPPIHLPCRYQPCQAPGSMGCPRETAPGCPKPCSREGITLLAVLESGDVGSELSFLSLSSCWDEMWKDAGWWERRWAGQDKISSLLHACSFLFSTSLPAESWLFQ